MEDQIPYGEQSHVHNTEGCDVHFNDENVELIPFRIMLTALEMEELIIAIKVKEAQTTDKTMRSVLTSIKEKITAFLRSINL